MPATYRDYYFGRLNIIAAYSNKTEYMFHAFRPGIRLEERGNIWQFIDFTNFEYNDEIYIHAYLTKYRRSFSEEVVNQETSQSEEGLIENLILAKSSFFLHVKSGTIAYQTIANHIPKEQFTSQFCKLFEKAHDNMLVDAEIQAIQEQYSIFEKIKEFQAITKISFRLHPSNPNLSPLWRDVDEDIKGMGASNHLEEYSVKKGSSNSLNIDRIELSEAIKSKFHMANDGYGKASISGIVNGNSRTITTGDNPTKITVLIRERVEDVFESVRSGFVKIFERFEG